MKSFPHALKPSVTMRSLVGFFFVVVVVFGHCCVLQKTFTRCWTRTGRTREGGEGKVEEGKKTKKPEGWRGEKGGELGRGFMTLFSWSRYLL